MTSPENLTIRAATTEDITGLSELTRIMWLEHAAHSPALWDIEATKSYDYGNYVAETLGKETVISFVATVNEEIIGSVHAEIKDLPPVFQHEKMLSIYDLGVSAAHRFRGIGKSLVAACVDAGRQQGTELAVAAISDWNEPSRRLFQSLGFTPRTSDHYLIT